MSSSPPFITIVPLPLRFAALLPGTRGRRPATPGPWPAPASCSRSRVATAKSAASLLLLPAVAADLRLLLALGSLASLRRVAAARQYALGTSNGFRDGKLAFMCTTGLVGWTKKQPNRPVITTHRASPIILHKKVADHLVCNYSRHNTYIHGALYFISFWNIKHQKNWLIGFC